MAIIREQISISGSKRLNGPTEPVVHPVAAEPVVLDREAVRASLREAFSEELEELEQDARKDGLLAAEQEIKSRIALLEKEKKQWQEEAARKATEHAQQLESSLAEVSAQLKKTQTEMQTSLQSLALEIAYASVLKVLGAQAADRKLIGMLVEQAVSEHALTAPYSVLVSVADHAGLPAVAADSGIEFVADEKLKRGECLIRHAHSRIDAGVLVQLEALKKLFLDTLDADHAEA